MEPEDYEAKLTEFREELASEERKMSDSRMLKPKQDALTKTEEYVAYLYPAGEQHPGLGGRFRWHQHPGKAVSSVHDGSRGGGVAVAELVLYLIMVS